MGCFKELSIEWMDERLEEIEKYNRLARELVAAVVEPPCQEQPLLEPLAFSEEL